MLLKVQRKEDKHHQSQKGKIKDLNLLTHKMELRKPTSQDFCEAPVV